MRGLNAKNLVEYRVNKFYIKQKKKLKQLELYWLICVCVFTILNTLYLISSLNPLISPCHRSSDNLLPSNQLLTYPKTYLDCVTNYIQYR